MLHGTSGTEEIPVVGEPEVSPVPARTSDLGSVAHGDAATQPIRSVHVSASPSVHVNVEVHIAADAEADTVREIFKNMARYVLNKPVDDDD